MSKISYFKIVKNWDLNTPWHTKIDCLILKQEDSVLHFRGKIIFQSYVIWLLFLRPCFFMRPKEVPYTFTKILFLIFRKSQEVSNQYILALRSNIFSCGATLYVLLCVCLFIFPPFLIWDISQFEWIEYSRMCYIFK